MACRPLPGGGFACGPRPKAKPCATPGCGKTSVALCDYPIVGGKTCSRGMCEGHRHNVGPDRDLCDPHFKIAGEQPRQPRLL